MVTPAAGLSNTVPTKEDRLSDFIADSPCQATLSRRQGPAPDEMHSAWGGLAYVKWALFNPLRATVPLTNPTRRRPKCCKPSSRPRRLLRRSGAKFCRNPDWAACSPVFHFNCTGLLQFCLARPTPLPSNRTVQTVWMIQPYILFPRTGNYIQMQYARKGTHPHRRLGARIPRCRHIVLPNREAPGMIFRHVSPCSPPTPRTECRSAP